MMKTGYAKHLKGAVIFALALIVSLIFLQYGKGHPQDKNPTAENIPGYKWEQALPFGNGSFQHEWKQGTFPLGIVPLTAFDGHLWMVGRKQTWFSQDGIHWTASSKDDWGERISMPYVFYRNKLWMYGGMAYKERKFLNDIWVSDDGSHWSQAGNAEWKPRKGHTMIVFKDRLWLFGGAIGILPDYTPDKFLNDIWSSEDGIRWREETASAPWSPRDNPNMVVSRDTLYMLGGQGHADVWMSVDGRSWKMLTAEAPWKKRYDFGALVFDNRMWVFGGRDSSENHTTAAMNDVWSSENGNEWTRHAEHAPWTVRSGNASVIFRDRIWLYSGKHTGGEHNWGGDVWTMTVGR